MEAGEMKSMRSVIRPLGLAVLLLGAGACDEETVAPTIGLTVLGTVHAFGGAPVSGAVVSFQLVQTNQTCNAQFTTTELPKTTTDSNGNYLQDIVISGKVTAGQYCVAVRVDPPTSSSLSTTFASRSNVSILSGSRPLKEVRIDVTLPAR
jgi:hypothetical protein